MEYGLDPDIFNNAAPYHLSTLIKRLAKGLESKGVKVENGWVLFNEDGAERLAEQLMRFRDKHKSQNIPWYFTKEVLIGICGYRT